MIVALARGLAAVVALGLFVAQLSPGRAQSFDELYAKAKSEGALAFYAGGPTAPWDARANAFGELYPGIKVSIVGGFSNVLDKKIDQQIAVSKLEVDAAILQTIADFARWKAEGQLLVFKPDGFDAMDASFKDPDGAFWATMVNVVPYMYNTEKVAAADVPNSALDFLKPAFRGKMVTPYPADDDVTLWVFHHIVQKYGWGYMDKYMAAKPNLIQGHLGQQRSIASGQNWITFDSIYDTTNELKRQGMPVESTLPNGRRAADLAADRRDLQGCAASKRSQAVLLMAPGARAARQARHLVAAQRRGAAGGLQADPELQRRQ